MGRQVNSDDASNQEALDNEVNPGPLTASLTTSQSLQVQWHYLDLRRRTGCDLVPLLFAAAAAARLSWTACFLPLYPLLKPCLKSAYSLLR
jgi:hypothetical protein